jgi:Holliday junction resolvase RusA-like endonuclease
MATFTSRSFKRYTSKKSKKSRKTKKSRKLNMNLQIKVHLRKEQQQQKGGGDTLSRRIPSAAVIVNPLEWDDKPDA